MVNFLSIQWNQGVGCGSVSARLPPGAAHVLRIETAGGRVVRLLATNWTDYELCKNHGVLFIT
jgi:hypothetical protein